MSSQRPFFLSTFLAAFRQQSPSALPTASQQPNKHATPASAAAAAAAASTPRSISTSAAGASPSPQTARGGGSGGGVMNQLPLHSPRSHGSHTAIPIPGGTGGQQNGRRRGSDSSSEGFRDVRGADKWYIGGRTAAGEEKFFKLGVVRRVRSGDRLSLDRLSL